MADKGVVNVAEYYHHGTVRVRGADDDIHKNIRKELDVARATNRGLGRAILPSSASVPVGLRKERSNSAGLKRPSADKDTAVTPSKRSRSATPTKAKGEPLPNRIHRRIIVQDYGTPIYKATSRMAILAALEC